MTIPAASLGFSALGTIIGGAGALAQGSAASAAGQYQQAIAKQNAEYANYQSAESISAGKIQEQQVRRQVAQTEASQRATAAALGQVVGVGTAGQVVADTAQLGETDAQTARRNAQREALSFKIQAQNDTANGTLAAAQGANAQTASFLNGAGTLLSGAGKFGSQYYGYQQSGAFKSVGTG